MQAVDYSNPAISPAAVMAHGYAGACRYSSPSLGKNLKDAEVAAYVALSGKLLLVFEWTATRSLEGFAAGVADARLANDQADALGMPHDEPIYYSTDTDADPAAVFPYVDGVISYGRRAAFGLGWYGGYRVVKALLDTRRISRAWQTVAWSYGARETRAVLFQRYGGATIPDTDVNDVLSPQWSTWPRATPPPPPPPAHDDGDDYDMGYTTDIDTLYEVHLDRAPDRPGFHHWNADYAFNFTVRVNGGQSAALAHVSLMNGYETFFAGVNESAKVAGVSPADPAHLAAFKDGIDAMVNATGDAKAAARNAGP